MKTPIQISPSSRNGAGRVDGLLLFATVGIAACLATSCGILPGALNPSSSGGGTQFSGTVDAGCVVSLYDAAYGFGFDLPADAELARYDNEQDALTNSLWLLTVDDTLLNVVARVREETSGATLGEIVQAENDDTLFAGGDLLLEESVTLASGEEAVHTIVEYGGVITSRVDALANGRVYTVQTVMMTDSRTDALDTFTSDIVLSLCLN